MFKRIATLLISLVTITTVFAGCNKLAVVPEEITSPEFLTEADALCGFFLTFESRRGELTDICSDDFESNDAVKFYLDRKKFEGTDAEYLEIICGKDVLFDCNTKTTVSDNDGVHSVKLDMSATLFFTNKLVGTIMFINPLYFDEELNKVYVKEDSALTGQQLSASVGEATAGYSEKVSASRTVNGVREALEYETVINLSYSYSDYLTGVRVIEYDKNNNSIISSNIDMDIQKEYSAGADCEYLILEETYRDRNDNQYVTRTLFSRPNKEETLTAILKKPLDSGLIEPKRLKIKFN